MGLNVFIGSSKAHDVKVRSSGPLHMCDLLSEKGAAPCLPRSCCHMKTVQGCVNICKMIFVNVYCAINDKSGALFSR